jgi:hypothetical protein
MKDSFYFGSLVRQIDVFAFPRTGSHFLAYCFSGLFDLISILPKVHRLYPEAITRQDELRPDALYGLELREPGLTYQPVWLNSLAGGTPHAPPRKAESPLLLLVRDPIATVYSAWRAKERLGFAIETAGAIEERFRDYIRFYESGFSLLTQHPTDSLLVRYEDIITSSAALERIVEFVGVRPKLRPDFVASLTRFDNFVRPSPRSFYREGRNGAWRDDSEWRKMISGLPDLDFTSFGYGSLRGT